MKKNWAIWLASTTNYIIHFSDILFGLGYAVFGVAGQGLTPSSLMMH